MVTHRHTGLPHEALLLSDAWCECECVRVSECARECEREREC